MSVQHRHRPLTVQPLRPHTVTTVMMVNLKLIGRRLQHRPAGQAQAQMMRSPWPHAHHVRWFQLTRLGRNSIRGSRLHQFVAKRRRTRRRRKRLRRTRKIRRTKDPSHLRRSKRRRRSTTADWAELAWRQTADILDILAQKPGPEVDSWGSLITRGKCSAAQAIR